MADDGQQRADMTQPQPNQGEWTGPRPSHPQIPPRNPNPRREGTSQHGNQVENQDSRQAGALDDDAGRPFNALVIKWEQSQG
jgi:hypothetical protein